MRETETVAEARRAMEICNACRYCEGFCAVFPAMELRREFSAGDLGYLANLCHGCNGCYHACQYAPPHEFGINLPQTLALLRRETYAHYAWPPGAGWLFQANGTVVSIVAALCLAAVLWLVSPALAPQSGPGSFYAVIPLGVMVGVAGITFLYALLALAMGTMRFWRDAGGDPPDRRNVAAAARDALTLKNLGDGGDGCPYPGESSSFARRRFHHALFYGFLLCFAATAVATIYHHVLGWIAPYELLSVPVVLGMLGGAMMVIGCVGLVWLKILADPAPLARAVLGGDYALLFLLLLVAITGLVLLALRSTAAMAPALAVHLGFVLALFLVLPYSKFVHAPYRLAALVRSARARE
jgi:citrate/tricarballylate utilization protein